MKIRTPAVLVMWAVTVGSAAAAPVAALDYYEIQQVNARFCHALDSAEGNGNAFADLFTPDGVFVTATGRRVAGHDQLAAFAREDADQRKGPTNIGHYVTNLTVDAMGDGARGHGYLLEATPTSPAAGGRGPGRAITDAGAYWDEMVRTPQGWRIRMRTLVRSNGPAPQMTAAAGAASAAVASMPHPFAAQDYADIDQLFALFGYGFDSAGDDGYQWARLFTPDGIFVAGSAVQSMKGRDTLAAFASGRLNFPGGFASLTTGPGTAKNPLAIQHILTDIAVEPVNDGAVAKVYRLNATIGNDGRASLAPGGVYNVLLARTAEGWRFKENWYMNAGSVPPDGAKRFMPTAASPAASASRGSMPPLTIPADDDAAIRQIYARFSQAMDSAADNGAALAQLFTPDGIFLDNWTSKVYTGTDQLAALARGTSPNGKGPTNLNHFIWTIRIEASPQGASARAYAMTGTLQEAGAPIVMTNGGQYWDDLVKTPDGWRFKKRTFYRTSQTPPPAQTASR
jgi:ketosteroid isomerase-like protein